MQEKYRRCSATAPLPGGDFAVDGFEQLVFDVETKYPFMPKSVARRLVRAYGTDSWRILQKIASVNDLGTDFGAGVFAAELDWLSPLAAIAAFQEPLFRQQEQRQSKLPHFGQLAALRSPTFVLPTSQHAHWLQQRLVRRGSAAEQALRHAAATSRPFFLPARAAAELAQATVGAPSSPRR